MKDATKPSPAKGKPSKARDLPSALRDNLKRRKAAPKAGLHRPPKVT